MQCKTENDGLPVPFDFKTEFLIFIQSIHNMIKNNQSAQINSLDKIFLLFVRLLRTNSHQAEE